MVEVAHRQQTPCQQSKIEQQLPFSGAHAHSGATMPKTDETLQLSCTNPPGYDLLGRIVKIAGIWWISDAVSRAGGTREEREV